jgi:hypothetical protein
LQAQQNLTVTQGRQRRQAALLNYTFNEAAIQDYQQQNQFEKSKKLGKDDY